MKGSVRRELFFDTAESETLGMWGNSMRENREILQTPALDGSVGRSKKAKSRNVDMDVCGESNGLIVPTKRANKVGAYALAAESAEERRPTKGNAPQAHSRRTQSRGCESQGLWRIRQAARAAGRYMNPRQEPYEVIPHVRIRAGGRSQGRSLPRLSSTMEKTAALSMLEDALERCRRQDMRTAEVYRALDFLEAHAVRKWPFDQFPGRAGKLDYRGGPVADSEC